MPYSLTYSDLPAEISQWPGLPLSLSGEEVMPLDYRAGGTGWLLYGKQLDKALLSQFQRELSSPILIVAAWHVGDYQVVRLAGTLTIKAKNRAEQLSLDIAPLEAIPHLNVPGLLVMDMDSTAIQIECIDEIAKLAGVGEEVTAVTERAMRGELDFVDSLRQRVAALKGTDIAVLEQIGKELPIMPGLLTLVSELQARGWHIAIASGGFTYFADLLREQLQLTEAVANQLEIDGGRLTGKVADPIVDARHKANTLLSLAERLQIPIEQTVAIGDGANDLKMLKVAGLGIAYHAKPKVFEKAKVGIRYADLMGVMCLLSSSLKYEER